MKMKSLPILALTLTAAVTLAARDINLKGGYLEPIDDVQIESCVDDMNFMFAYRFSDGTIHLDHSKGIHTVTEYGCHDFSPDGGRTWKNNVGVGTGINTFEGLDGGKYQVGCWDFAKTSTHTVTLQKYDDATKTKNIVTRCQLELPFESEFKMHRDVVRLASRKLLATAYGVKKGEDKLNSYCIGSEDDGRTWKYLSTIAADPEGKTMKGPNETGIFQLPDGRVVALYRDDNGQGPLHQCFSSDEGRTWTAPEVVPLSGGCADPSGRVLADGTVVVICGRPGIYLLVDFSGTCKEYQRVDISVSSSCGYGSVLETAPNEILCIYGESSISTWKAPTPFSRIHASRFTVNRSQERRDDDPLAAKYDHFFRPTTMESLVKGRSHISHASYMPKDKFPNDLTTMEILSIPERPHPVLHIVSHGNNEGNGMWAHLKATEGTEKLVGSKEVKVGAEFRLGDAGEEGYQFHIAGVVGATEDKANSGYLAFAKFAQGKIKLDGQPEKEIPYDIGTDKFHTFYVVGDAETRTVSLYVEGRDEPLATTTMVKFAGRPQITVGDGSGSIYGSTFISYFGWTIK